MGVETIRRLLPMVEQGLPEYRQVAKDFDWKLIEGNVNLPYPYIVSLSARPDNEYMWSKYAKTDGVVLEVDDSVFVPNQELTMMMSKPCLYTGLLSDKELTKCIQNEYTYGGLALLKGPMGKDAFELLEKQPQVFVRLIAMYLLTFVATRVKDKEYHKEEETRVIIQSQRSEIAQLVKANRDIIQNALHLDPDALEQAMQQEKMRQRGDKTIFYRDCNIPIKMLRAVYVRPEYQGQVKEVLRRLVPREIPVHVFTP